MRSGVITVNGDLQFSRDSGLDAKRLRDIRIRRVCLISRSRNKAKRFSLAGRRRDAKEQVETILQFINPISR